MSENEKDAQERLWNRIDRYIEVLNHETAPSVSAARDSVEEAINWVKQVAVIESDARNEWAVTGNLEAESIDGMWPGWVYAARKAYRHQTLNLPWLPDLLAAMGWRGGTIHQALSCVRRVFNDREEKAQRRERDLIDALRRIETTLAPIAVAASQGGSIPAYQAHLMAREALRQTERQAANQKGGE